MSFILPSCESTQEMDATDDIYDLKNTLSQITVHCILIWYYVVRMMYR